MPSKNKNKTSRPNFYGITIVALLAVSGYVAFFVLQTPEQDPENSKRYSPEQWSQKLIEVKKEPIKSLKKSLFGPSLDPLEKAKEAQQVIYNQMLSQVESRLSIPMTVSSEAVAQEAQKDLGVLYGDPTQVPRSVYRTACLRIYNSQGDFQRFYHGNPKKIEGIVYEVILDFYDRGQPPDGLSISNFDAYMKKHAKAKRSRTPPGTPTQH